MNKISGVYKITNEITGDFYIGSSKHVKHRWANHKCPSQWAQLPNLRMYQDMQKYGLNSFLFEIIEETTELKEREQYWMNKLKPTYNNYRANGWNLEGYKEDNREWLKTHRECHLCQLKTSRHKLCLYESETLTLGALSGRFHKLGIPHAWLEAKKYLLENNN